MKPITRTKIAIIFIVILLFAHLLFWYWPRLPREVDGAELAVGTRQVPLDLVNDQEAKCNARLSRHYRYYISDTGLAFPVALRDDVKAQEIYSQANAARDSLLSASSEEEVLSSFPEFCLMAGINGISSDEILTIAQGIPKEHLTKAAKRILHNGEIDRAKFTFIFCYLLAVEGVEDEVVDFFSARMKGRIPATPYTLSCLEYGWRLMYVQAFNGHEQSRRLIEEFIGGRDACPIELHRLTADASRRIWLGFMGNNVIYSPNAFGLHQANRLEPSFEHIHNRAELIKSFIKSGDPISVYKSELFLHGYLDNKYISIEVGNPGRLPSTRDRVEKGQ